MVGQDRSPAGSGKGCPAGLNTVFDIARYFGLDPYQQFWFSHDRPDDRGRAAPRRGDRLEHGRLPAAPAAVFSRPQPGDRVDAALGRHARTAGEAVVWITLEGFFWFPRTLDGLHQDQPGLLRPAGTDPPDQPGPDRFQSEHPRPGRQACRPTFATIAEDMSYNHGPMISERHFDEFIAPYYRQIVPRLQEMGRRDHRGHRRRRDAAGSLAAARRAFTACLPLERQAGVDGMALRRQSPDVCAWSATSTRW